jgi:hypothetical protein
LLNLAERLGYAADDCVLILHADDVGSTHAANAATFECMDRGSLTSGSILVPAGWFPEVADYARTHPNADLGVHLTVNSEYSMYRWRPLTDRSAAPGLYDDEGYLWRTVAESAAHVSAEEAELELRAQIDKAIAASIDVTHIDTHMTEFMLQPKFLNPYVSLGLEYRLPMIIFRPNPDRLRKAGLGEFWDALEPQIKRLDNAGFPVMDHVFPSQFQGSVEERPAYFSNIFENLRPGVTHFLVHPTQPSEEVAAMTGSAPFRAAEYEYFRDRSVAEELARLGVHTITYREIRQAYREGKLR